MKYILSLVVMTACLYASEAWASSGGLEQYMSTTTPRFNESATIGNVQCFVDDKLVTCQHGDPIPVNSCLAKMEAAMRKMDEFTPKRHVHTFSVETGIGYLHCDDACSAQQIIASAEAEVFRVTREQSAITYWGEVKAQCWSRK